MVIKPIGSRAKAILFCASQAQPKPQRLINACVRTPAITCLFRSRPIRKPSHEGNGKAHLK